jgi:hypothetical protein
MATAQVSADIRNRLSPHHKEDKNFIDSALGEQKQKISENTVVMYVIRCFYGIEETYFDLFLKNP